MTFAVMDKPNFLIVGCGAVGIAYTYILSRAVPESNIFTVCRSNFEIARTHGFRVNSAVWGDNLQVKPNVVRSVAEAVEKNHGRKFDFILISTKSIPLSPSIPESIEPAVDTGKTGIVLFQNGVGIEDPYAQTYPSNPIISVVVYIKVIETATAVVEHNNVEFLHLGTFPSDAPRLHKVSVTKLADILTSGGASLVVHEDVQMERWSKALINSVWNPVSALTRLGDASFIATDMDVVDMIRHLMREVAAVAKACGYSTVNDELVETHLRRNLERKPPGVQFSMMFDAANVKTMEVDAVIGNIVALGEQKGVKIHMLKMLYLLIKGLNASFTEGSASGL